MLAVPPVVTTDRIDRNTVSRTRSYEPLPGVGFAGLDDGGGFSTGIDWGRLGWQVAAWGLVVAAFPGRRRRER